MFRVKTLLALLVFCHVFEAGSAVAARGQVQYSCPNLKDEKKTSIEPLAQGYDGWFFRSNDLKMDFSISPKTAHYFARLASALEDRGIDMILVPLLSRALMAPGTIDHEDSWQENYDPELAQESYAEMIESLRAKNVKVVDLLALMKTYESEDSYLYNFKRDIHWKPEGARIIAEITAEELKKLPHYADFPKVETVLEKREEVGRSGTITEELQKMCDDPIEAESFVPYKAERVTAQNADALFGGEEGDKVPVAMTGTSFSAVDDFNFLPFLEKYSKAEIVNFSIPGGGMFTSLISYLSSPFFHENIPPALIWETQSVYDLNKSVEYAFRQAIPAVSGPCTGDDIMEATTLDITDDKENYTLLENIEKLKVGGDNYYLHFYIENFGFKQFTLEMEYDDQDGEWFPIDRSDRYNNKGHYYIELSEKISGNLSKVIMKDTPNIRTRLDVQLCRKAKKAENAVKEADTAQPSPRKETP
ncbi:MAG: hypothetical protein IT559_01815 [Alphaproteobacteria bacterium]|nr:hypothetical protein [Alphaproteobacteria bacterium]